MCLLRFVTERVLSIRSPGSEAMLEKRALLSEKEKHIIRIEQFKMRNIL